MHFLKKILFAYVVFSPLLHSMDLPPSKKPKLAEKPVEIKSIFNLNIPILGTDQFIDEKIDLAVTEDAAEHETLGELLKIALKENRDFIIARVVTKQGEKYFKEYYELPHLNKWLFAGNLVPDNPATVLRYTLQTPKRADIVGQIYYFIYQPVIFEFFGTDYDLCYKKEQLLISMLALPTEKQLITKELFF